MDDQERGGKSDGRDLLSSERTFLAWVRTGLAFIGVGVLAAKLAPEKGRDAAAMGIGFIAVGFALILYGLRRHQRANRMFERGVFEPDRKGPVVLVIVSFAIAVGASLYLIFG